MSRYSQDPKVIFPQPARRGTTIAAPPAYVEPISISRSSSNLIDLNEFQDAADTLPPSPIAQPSRSQPPLPPRQTDRGPGTRRPNIIIFGETGTGKSSVVNMIAEQELASTSSGAVGETFESRRHDIVIDEELQCRIWDTAGLNEGANGRVPADKALDNLRGLVIGLEDGVDLLVYCIRAGRFRDILKVNYDLFHGIICQGKVPIVLVVTGLENESPMDKWWRDNQHEFTAHGLQFVDKACITASRGKVMRDGSHMFEEEFEQSKNTVKALIKRNCSGQVGWKLASRDWIRQISWRLQDYMEQFNQRSGRERQALQEEFDGRRSQSQSQSSGRREVVYRPTHQQPARLPFPSVLQGLMGFLKDLKGILDFLVDDPGPNPRRHLDGATRTRAYNEPRQGFLD